ncbi:MAG: hypothetical protein U9N35_09040 [Euryarchaeota archaeon]|nr:hypothetical protein [Euryarchaeota archaeon]
MDTRVQWMSDENGDIYQKYRDYYCKNGCCVEDKDDNVTIYGVCI